MVCICWKTEIPSSSKRLISFFEKNIILGYQDHSQEKQTQTTTKKKENNQTPVHDNHFPFPHAK